MKLALSVTISSFIESQSKNKCSKHSGPFQRFWRIPGWIFSSFTANSDQTLFCTAWSCSRGDRLEK